MTSFKYFDLESSAMPEIAKMIAALERQKSRGSHQKSDYPELNLNGNSNYFFMLNKETLDLEVQKKNIIPLIKKHQNILEKPKEWRI